MTEFNIKGYYKKEEIVFSGATNREEIEIRDIEDLKGIDYGRRILKEVRSRRVFGETKCKGEFTYNINSYDQKEMVSSVTGIGKISYDLEFDPKKFVRTKESPSEELIVKREAQKLEGEKIRLQGFWKTVEEGKALIPDGAIQFTSMSGKKLHAVPVRRTKHFHSSERIFSSPFLSNEYIISRIKEYDFLIYGEDKELVSYNDLKAEEITKAPYKGRKESFSLADASERHKESAGRGIGIRFKLL